MKLYLLITALFISLTTFAQIVPNSYFANPVTINCPLDTTHSIITFAEWEAYQTSNDLWNGTKDSSHCFDIDNPANFYGSRILLSQSDSTHAVFLRLKLDGTNRILLDSNSLHKLDFDSYPSQGLHLDTGNACPDGYCSGVLVGVEIPDSAGTGTAMRWYDAGIVGGKLRFCFATEYFPQGNYLRELIVKIRALPGSYNDSLLIYNLSIENLSSSLAVAQFFDSSSVLPYNISQFQYMLYNSFSANNYLVMHNQTYPSVANVTHLDFYPVPNTVIQSQVDITVDYFASLNFQPFTDLRGGLVLGDTIRHTINLILQGGNICMYPFIERIHLDHDQFTYRSGAVDFEGHSSCMLFARGGTLRVDDGAEFHYGSPGKGILALKTGANIEIGKNAALIIHNTVMMYEFFTDNGPQQIYLSLKRGSRLVFAKGSRLSNQYSKDGTMKLNVYMKGGELDDSGLPENERQLIRRIYDIPDKDDDNNLTLFSNPFNGNLDYSFIGAKGKSFEELIFDIQGKQVHNASQVCREGVNFYTVNIGNLSKGIYFLKLEMSDGKTAMRKLVKE